MEEKTIPVPSDSSPCAESCLDPSCCNLCPCTYGEIDWLFLKRTAGRPIRAFFVDANTQDPLASSSDFNFDWDPGVRAIFGFHLGECRAVEFGYFGLFDSRASLTFSPTDGPGILPGDMGGMFRRVSGRRYGTDRLHVADSER